MNNFERKRKRGKCVWVCVCVYVQESESERERAREQRPLLNVAAVIGQKSKNNPRLLFLQQQLGLSFECLQFIAAATRWRERERERERERKRERERAIQLAGSSAQRRMNKTPLQQINRL